MEHTVFDSSDSASFIILRRHLRLDINTITDWHFALSSGNEYVIGSVVGTRSRQPAEPCSS